MIHQDYSMYYGGTFVGYRQGNVILPFNVNECSISDSFLSRVNSLPRSQFDSIAFGQEAYEEMTFHGRTFNPETGRETNKAVSSTDSNLVLDLPDPTYIKMENGSFVWVSYHANRSTKKGIDARKVCFSSRNVRLTKQVVFQMYNPECPEVFGRVLVKNGNKLGYKGVHVGNFPDTTSIVLKFEAKHLFNLVQKEFPECQVVVDQPTTSN